MNNNERAKQIAEKMLSEDKHSQQLGIEIVAAEVGYSVCKMTLNEIHLNGHGTCHGGVIFSLADTTFAHVCNAHNQLAVAHMCNIAYWKPGLANDTLYAVARENGVYGRSGSYTITVHCGSVDGEIIAEFNGFSRSLRGEQHFPECAE
ncbi:MAG: phenylacetic acid degradation protein PaaD [Gammaproteobacteria bacterium]|nr:MAG: phenylacetic acid degradation protein PaaD [Gammaproteobacteria bacterium]